MSIIANIMGSMSEADKAKLGKGGTKINTDGEHTLTITEAYEITWNSAKGSFPSFVLKMEDAEGKTIEWSGFLKRKLKKDDKGNLPVGEYSVNGVKTYLDQEGQEYDDLKVIGQINNLWKVCGLDPKQFGAGITAGTVTFKEKGTVPVENWTALIGKKFIGVTSYVVSLDTDGKRVWRNQEINMNALFNAAGLSIAEMESGKTEGTALAAAVAAAKANASIAYNDRANKLCIQELKLIQGAGTVPATESVPAAANAGTVKPF